MRLNKKSPVDNVILALKASRIKFLEVLMQIIGKVFFMAFFN